MQGIFLVLSSILIIAGVIPYLRDVVRGKTKPRIVSWFNWTLLTGIATAAALAEGQYPSAVLTAAGTLVTALVVVLGLKYGDRKFEAFDIVCQLGAILGLILWVLSNNPTVALLTTVVIDFIAGLPTLRHAWQKPYEETAVTFLYASIGGFFSILAIENWALAGLIYPVFITLINGLLAAIVFSRSRILVSQKTHS